MSAQTSSPARASDASGRDTRLRILVLASTFPRWQGDTEPAFVYNLSRRLTDRFDITVLAPHAPGCQRNERWGDLRILRFRYFWPTRFQRLAYGGILPNLKRNRWLWLLVPFFLAAEFFAALRIVRSEHIDVLHAHWVIPQGVIAVLVGRITGTPVVATAHGGDIYALSGWWQNKIKRWTLNRCSYVTAVSHNLLELIHALGVNGEQRAEVISMGVDTRQFHPTRRDEAVKARLSIEGSFILFVGRLVEKKGVRYLLEAMPRVLRAVPDTTLVIAGDGPLHDELARLADDLGISSRVRFIKATSQANLPAYYATADLFVGPSIVAEDGDTESFGVVFAEAMASGCPVVATDVGGISDVVIANETGLLVPQQSPAALAEAICALLADSALRARLAANAPRRAAEFDWESVTQRTAAVYRQVTDGHSTA